MLLDLLFIMLEGTKEERRIVLLVAGSPKTARMLHQDLLHGRETLRGSLTAHIKKLKV